ncbi:MAG: histidinol-phosphate aminotransferase family protein [Lewinellaceae bacterium]|nr:histidinol-phosphate aminotransferase family protein [Phaeodactylibacter sp.]MCB0613387.1 histidinol-phosphate aminotransferase family protein [Phaeodactylibacter sp.]MCB9347876.1 histidinol-phosphate aminotransferase family protein [Lewinellaceae bacterium]
MEQLNRRQWLRTAGLAGAATLAGSWTNLAGNPIGLEQAGSSRQDGFIRLNANENPLGPSEKVRAAMMEAFDVAYRYPFSWQQELTKKLARKEGVTPEHIVVTAGSVEGLRISGLAYSWQGGEIVAADPTFQALLAYAEQFGAFVHRVPLDDLVHDLDAMERRITSNTRLVFICNPNNPTGTILPAGRLRDFCTSVSRRTVVFADEAYYDFIQEPGYPSMVELVKDGLNVIVSRTFSKVYGLAGLRIGYLIARPDIARRLNNARVAFNNVVGLYAAMAALEDEAFYRESLKNNAASQRIIYQTLEQMNLLSIQSHGNFVFFQSRRDISELIEEMKQEKVLIGRPFPPLMDWCRLSTGTVADTEQACRALKKVLAG